MKKIHDIIATVGGLGRLPLAPGTWGSLAGLGLCLILHGNTVWYLITFVALFAVGVISSDKVEAESGQKDPRSVVIDEFACIFLVYLFIPLNLSVIIAGFVLYRVFDITKVPPMRSLENLKGGWAIMLDDLAAAIYSNLILRILLHYNIL